MSLRSDLQNRLSEGKITLTDFKEAILKLNDLTESGSNIQFCQECNKERKFKDCFCVICGSNSPEGDIYEQDFGSENF